MSNPFTYLELHTADAARAKAFYCELFGWKTQDTPVPDAGFVYTEIDTQEGPPAGVMPVLTPGIPAGWLSYVRVKHLDESLARALKLGATVTAPRGEVKGVGWFAVIRDPAGASIGLFEKTGG